MLREQGDVGDERVKIEDPLRCFLDGLAFPWGRQPFSPAGLRKTILVSPRILVASRLKLATIGSTTTCLEAKGVLL